MAQDTQRATRAYIQRVLDKMGIKGTELARGISVAPSTINRFMNSDDATHTLGLATLAKVAAYSDMPVPPSVLKVAEAAQPRSDVDFSRQIPIADGLRDLPVYGSVKGSFLGEAVDSLNPVDWLVRPPVLRGAAKGFGVYVVGPSMEPRYHQGEIVLVHPGRPVARGAYVVVVLVDDTAILKKLLRQTDDFVEVEQINPPDKTRLPRAKVAGVYRVVGTQEG